MKTGVLGSGRVGQVIAGALGTVQLNYKIVR